MEDLLPQEGDGHAMGFAVVACSRCRTAWTVEKRHLASRCPRCPALVDLRRRRRLWEGDSADDARQAAAAFNTALAQGRPEAEAEQAVLELAPEPVVPRHDSPLDVAAAKARGVTNLSDRAAMVTEWLSRLLGDFDESQALQAMGKAGVPQERAERELVRLLATDVLFEPRAGRYRTLA